jgi:hypothetical protein
MRFISFAARCGGYSNDCGGFANGPLQVQSVVETATVFVEATDEQAAEDLALEIAKTGREPKAGEPEALLLWVFKDTLDGIEVIGVEELRS